MTRTKSGDLGISRRSMILAGAGVLASGEVPISARAADRRTSRGARPATGRRMLLKGGSIVSMDPKVGDFVQGDLLIEGTKIVAIERTLSAGDALTLDASNTIVMPGFVDAHRHAWEGQLRRLAPDIADFKGYMAATHMAFAPHYRPHDMYVGNLVTALGCIDAGITCMIDNSHNSRSSAHSDMAIRALIDSGIRAVHASGAPAVGAWNKQWPQDLSRLQKTFFTSNDQLVTLGMLAFPDPSQWALARTLGLRIYGELLGSEMGSGIDRLAQAGLVGPDNTFNHCADLPESTWATLKKVGAAINVCPRSDSQYALGDSFSAFRTAVDHGMKPGFSIDNEVSYGGDMFGEMRVAFHMQRAVSANRRRLDANYAPSPVTVRDVLACASVNGAVCAGLSGKIGRLAPGMEADLIAIRTDGIDLYPSNNAIGTVVGAADRSNVDTVIVGGVVRKRNGKMVGIDMTSIRKMIDESRGYLFARAGIDPGIFTDRFAT